MAECLEALLALMKKNIDEAAADNDNECATLDLRDKWRAEDFYVQATDAVYRKHEKRLKKLYDGKIDYHEFVEANRKLLGLPKKRQANAYSVETVRAFAAEYRRTKIDAQPSI